MDVFFLPFSYKNLKSNWRPHLLVKLCKVESIGEVAAEIRNFMQNFMFCTDFSIRINCDPPSFFTHWDNVLYGEPLPILYGIKKMYLYKYI